MPTITFIHTDGTKQDLEVPADKHIMQAAVAEGLDGIIGECGGQAMCATCHVYVDPSWYERLPDVTDDEDAMLDDTASPRTSESRLSCQLRATEKLDGLVLRLPEEQI
jgi:2Fe-2S ferredoxin